MRLILKENNYQLKFLFIASIVLLFGMLGAREIWTQEHRWADIVSGMFYRHDFLHPYLGENSYYDKPLLSYWLIAGVAWLDGLTTSALRVPSALAGLLSIWSIYRLGIKIKNQQMGLLAGWMLLTTFYFIFWARTSSADMLNMAGSLFAVSWYFDKRDQAHFFDFMIFFLILAVTSLCKGLIGAVVPVIAIFPDLIIKNRWKNYFRISILMSVIPALVIYLIPFLASSYMGGDQYGENGLYLVYRENILRYFQPFDHKDPIYTYFIYLPIYLLPWTLFFIPALLTLKSRWKVMSAQSRWIVWSSLLIFLFLTLSGSRRSYYVLPILPFAILFTADWILSQSQLFIINWVNRFIMCFFAIFFIHFCIVQPGYYSQGGIQAFSERVKHEMTMIKPLSEWQVTLLDAESKITFYMQLPPSIKNYDRIGNRNPNSIDNLMAAWPLLKKPQQNNVFISREKYKHYLDEILKDYKLIEAQPSLGARLFSRDYSNLPIAYIPKG